MNTTAAEQLLIRMVGIPSPSEHESQLASFLVEQCQSMGMNATTDDVGNLVVESGLGGPVILLLGHLDTVLPEIPARVTERQLYGRGSVDAKAALGAFIMAASELQNIPARIIVVGAVEEETATSRGARHIVARYKPDAVVIGEPSGWTNITLGYKGRVELQYRVTCRPAHSAAPVDRATEFATAFWHQTMAYIKARSTHSGFHSLTAALTHIAGTAEAAKLTIAFRTPPGCNLDTLRDDMVTLARPGEVTFSEATPAVEGDRTCPPARALVNTIRRAGRKPGIRLKSGTSDMNIVAQFWSVPMVAYGPGDSSLDHTLDEHIDLDEYIAAINVLTDALPALAHELGSVESMGYTVQEEEEIARRLQALGYLD